jgi:hypothetical protein
MPIIPGLSKVRDFINPARRTNNNQQPPFDKTLTLEQKLQAIFLATRNEDRNGRIRHARNWYRSALYYQGFQNIVWNDVSQSFDLYEPYAGEDWYIENQYRKDIWTNISVLNRNDLEPTTRPQKNIPDDIAASEAASSSLEVVWEEIGYKQAKTWKNLYLAIFGNAFAYSDYAVDRKFGTILEPQFKYGDIAIPGAAVCPQCLLTASDTTDTCPTCPPNPATGQGVPMEKLQPQNVTTKMADGFNERPKGQLFTIMCSPLEIYARSKVRDSVPYLPYLHWVRRVDQDIVQTLFPKEKIQGGGFTDEDLSQFYIDVLSNLTGGSLDALTDARSSRYYNEVEYAMSWIRPDLFRGDRELEKEFPDGAKFDLVQGNVIPDTARNESMDDHWAHFRYIINPHSLWGDGCVDAIPVQDQINETNALITRHIRYSVVPKTLYDPTVIDIEDVSNNPEESWIRGNPTLDNPLANAVKPLPPSSLSGDVAQWMNHIMQAHQQMTGAFDAVSGESIGANAPYSAYVFMNERAQGRFLPTFDMNSIPTINWTRQLLKLAVSNWIDPRERKFIDHTGKWAFQKLLGSDIGQGDFDVIITNQETRPKTRAEKVQGLEAAIQNGVDVLSSPKMLIYAYDLWGIPLDSSNVAENIQKAWRNLDKLKQGQPQVVPIPLLDDLPAHIATFKEFLNTNEADTLHDEQPQIWQNIYQYLLTCTQMMGMQQQFENHMQAGTQVLPAAGSGGAPQQQGPPPPKPPGQANAPVNRPEMAQAPVGRGNQVPLPPLPAGARQT